MILLEEAQRILNEIPVKPDIESARLDKALGRILAQDIISKINMPPFNKSAMDGYGVIPGDRSDRFKIIETISAGKIPQKKVHPGECVKVMTGGIVPEAADQVIIRELTVEENGYMKVTGEERNKNVCIAGEDIKKGENFIYYRNCFNFGSGFWNNVLCPKSLLLCQHYSYRTNYGII